MIIMTENPKGISPSQRVTVDNLANLEMSCSRKSDDDDDQYDDDDDDLYIIGAVCLYVCMSRFCFFFLNTAPPFVGKFILAGGKITLI